MRKGDECGSGRIMRKYPTLHILRSSLEIKKNGMR